MGWFDIFELSHFDQNYSYAAGLFLGVPLVAGIIYMVRQYYIQANTYESIDDNETLRAKMEAARLKQQEKYSQFVQENAEKLKEISEKLEKELQESRNSGKKDDRRGSRGGSDKSLFDRDYMPLMGGGSGGATYRPAKKRPCGPCGGGCG